MIKDKGGDRAIIYQTMCLQLMSGCKNVCLAGGPSTFLFLGGKKRKNRCHILNPHSYNRRIFSLQRSLQKREKGIGLPPVFRGRPRARPGRVRCAVRMW